MPDTLIFRYTPYSTECKCPRFTDIPKYTLLINCAPTHSYTNNIHNTYRICSAHTNSRAYKVGISRSLDLQRKPLEPSGRQTVSVYGVTFLPTPIDVCVCVCVCACVCVCVCVCVCERVLVYVGSSINHRHTMQIYYPKRAIVCHIIHIILLNRQTHTR